MALRRISRISGQLFPAAAASAAFSTRRPRAPETFLLSRTWIPLRLHGGAFRLTLHVPLRADERWREMTLSKQDFRKEYRFNEFAEGRLGRGEGSAGLPEGGINFSRLQGQPVQYSRTPRKILVRGLLCTCTCPAAPGQVTAGIGQQSDGERGEFLASTCLFMSSTFWKLTLPIPERRSITSAGRSVWT